MDKPQKIEIGVRQEDYVVPEAMLPKHAGRLQDFSLRELATDYEFFLPYVPWGVLGDSGIDPVAEVSMQSSKPIELLYWHSPYQLVVNLKSLQQLGMSTSKLFGVSKEQWPLVRKCANQVILTEATSSKLAFYSVQSVKIYDWNARKSKSVRSPEDLQVKVATIDVNFSEARFHLQPAKEIDGIALQQACVMTKKQDTVGKALDTLSNAMLSEDYAAMVQLFSFDKRPSEME